VALRLGVVFGSSRHWGDLIVLTLLRKSGEEGCARCRRRTKTGKGGLERWSNEISPKSKLESHPDSLLVFAAADQEKGLKRAKETARHRCSSNGD
jgi:hypothetical protein